MPEILIRFYTIRENLLNKVDFFFFHQILFGSAIYNTKATFVR